MGMMNDFELCNYLSKELDWPRISVVIPSYNQGQFLEDTICSIISQEYYNLDLILIDGDSSDDSLQIIRKYESRLTYWVSEPDKGQSNAINKGFAKCTGDIVTFLGSDDTYAPRTLADVAQRFRENPNVGAIVGAFQVQNEKSEIIGPPILPQIPHTGPIDLTIIAPGQYRLHQVSTFYTRSALEKVGFWVREDMKYVMDRELLYRVCRSYPIIITNEVYGDFRKHESSKSESDVISFANEFSRLYLESMSGEAKYDKIRKRNARFFKAKGFIKFAKISNNLLQAIQSLLRVPFLMPTYILSYTYLYAWKLILQKAVLPKKKE